MPGQYCCWHHLLPTPNTNDSTVSCTVCWIQQINVRLWYYYKIGNGCILGSSLSAWLPSALQLQPCWGIQLQHRCTHATVWFCLGWWNKQYYIQPHEENINAAIQNSSNKVFKPYHQELLLHPWKDAKTKVTVWLTLPALWLIFFATGCIRNLLKEIGNINHKPYTNSLKLEISGSWLLLIRFA